MDIEGKGVTVQVNPTEQSDGWLIGAAQEIAEAAEARGLELPAFAGTVAVEATTEVSVDPPEVKEAITGRLDTAFTGYQTIAEQLNGLRKKKEQVEVADQETVAREFEAWFTEDKLAYVAEAMEADPELRFILIGTPDVTATADEAIKLAETFGKGQPYSTSVWSEIVKRYTPEQLSGTNPANGNQVQFGLVPNKFNPDLYGTVTQQGAALAKLQADMPDLRVPSFLEDMTFWQTLRAQGDSLKEGAVFDRTYIRHFDLPEQRIGGDVYVLRSSVYGGGQPNVGASVVPDDYYGRALVG